MEIVILFGLLFLFGGRGGSGSAPAEPQPEPETPELPPPEEVPEPRPPNPEVDLVPPGPVSPGEIRGIAAELGLPSSWGDFLAAVAEGESRRHPAAINEADAWAARAGYDRNTWLHDCDVPRERYEVGSVGLYQLLPSSGMRAFKGTPYQCMDPIEALSDPYLATIAAVQYARRVMGWSAWKNSDKTWRALRHGWRSPGLTDDDRPDIDARFAAALGRIGLPESFMDGQVPKLPTWDVEELVRRRIG